MPRGSGIVARTSRKSGSKNWKQGSSWAWRKTRRAVILRDGGVCQLRLPGCTYRATAAHHTLGRGVTGDDMAHIVAACQHCNLKVGDPSSSDPMLSGRGTRW